MKTKRLQRIISAVMVLAMLVGTLGVLSFGAGATDLSTAADEDIGFDQIIGYDSETIWKSTIRDNNYGSSNRSDNDGWTGTITWYKDYTYDTAEKALTVINPGTGEHGIQWGPYRTYSYSSDANERAAFSADLKNYKFSVDVLYTTGSFDGLKIHSGSGKDLVLVGSDGIAKVDGVSFGQMSDGWNTIVMYFMGQTDETGKVTSFNIYCTMNPARDDGIRLSDIKGLHATSWSRGVFTDGQSFWLHPTASATAEDPSTLTVRNFKTIKMVEKYIEPVNPNLPTTIKGYSVNTNGYTSNWAGSSITTGGTWGQWVKSDAPYSGVLQWAPSYTGATLDAENGILNFDVATAAPAISLLPWQGTGVSIAAGPVRFTFDVWYDDATPNIICKGPNGTIWFFYVNANGKLMYNEGNYWWNGAAVDTGFTLQKNCWNTIDMVIIPLLEDGTISTSSTDTLVSRELYLRTLPTDQVNATTYGYTQDLLDTFYHKSVTIEGCLKHFISGGAGMTLTADPKADGVLKLRSAKIANLTADMELHAINATSNTYYGTSYLPVDYDNKSFAMPSIPETKFITTNTKTSVSNVVNAGESVIINTNYEILVAKEDTSKFTGANMSLGGSMVLNMKVDPATLTNGTLHRLSVIASGTSITAEANDALDEFGYYSIPLTGIPASNMGDVLTLYAISCIDGDYYISVAKEYSALIYATNLYQKDSTSEQVKGLLVKLMNYGAVAESNRYGTHVTKDAAEALGITFVSETPEDSAYTRAEMTQTDKDTINGIASTAATLAESINISFLLNEAQIGTITALTVTCDEWSETYTATDGILTITGIHAGAIRNVYELNFTDSTGATVAKANFVIGNYLKGVIGGTDANEAKLATATVHYMLAVREYSLQAN